MADTGTLQRQMAAFFKQDKERIKVQWIHVMKAKGLFDKLSSKEMETEPDRMYDICIEYLENGSVERVNEYAGVYRKRHIFEGIHCDLRT